MSSAERIGWLMFRYVRNELSRREKKELATWRSLSVKNESFFQSAIDPENLRTRVVKMAEARKRIFEKLRQRFPEIPDMSPNGAQPGKVFYLSRSWRIAAAIALIVGSGWYFFIASHSPIEAGGYQASVVSPDGATDDLSSIWSDMKRGFYDGSAGIIRKTENGQLIYVAPNHPGSPKDKYYTLFTKKGGEYALQLPDGTTVWVNAETSIMYPANISQDTIHIAINGEAYFELGNASHTYTVSTPSAIHGDQALVTDPRSSRDSLQITARNAHFNVMAYPNEPFTTVTLFSGTALVRLNSSTADSALSLVPGRKAKRDAQQLNLVQATDSADIIAWKNNRTSFHDAGIQTIMRYVARWYNVNIIYHGNIPDKLFTLSVSREAKIAELLRVLEKQGAHFKIHGKTITVIF
ncbi:MAG: FecR family protein [Chitinophagales bacterium]